MSASEFLHIKGQNKITEEEFYPMIGALYEQIWLNLLPPQLVTDDLATRVANNVITSADDPIPDCQTCGACCASMLCIGISPTEEEEIPTENYWDITAKTSGSGEITVDRYLRRNVENGACAALEGEVGGMVECGIYEQRPRICRAFEAGSDKCRALRRAYGIEPFLTLQEMFEGLQKLKAKDAEIVTADVIRDAKIVEQAGTNLLEIKVLMKDGSFQTIHTFDPEREIWRQFEFSGLTLSQAKDLISSRRQGEIQ
jgi:Fe-S-cluster containining protein